jgi:hypothetical protein
VASTAIGYMTQDAPQYRDALRTLGAYLDWLHAEYVTLCEIDDGFVWHSFAKGDLTRPVSGMVPHADLARLMSSLKSKRTGGIRHANRPVGARRSSTSAHRQPVCVDGYQETFRTIGARLDRAKALAVLLVESDESLIVNYSYPVPGYLRRDLHRLASSYSQAQDAFTRKQLAEMVVAARGNRNNPFYH